MKTIKINNFCKTALALVFICQAQAASAWNHGISIGYGGGEDPNHTNYSNYGTFISSEMTTLKAKKSLHLTLDGALGFWNSTYSANKDLFTGAVSLALRVYLLHSTSFHPYGIVSAGPAYLSERKFGQNVQAGNFAFQSIAGLGFEVGKQKRFDFNLKLVHFSNAYLMHPNHGFNIVYVGSIGYLF